MSFGNGYEVCRLQGLASRLTSRVEQAHLFTFPGDEKQSEILQHSDSLNFFKILINHEAFWQPPQILRNPYLICQCLSAYSVWSQLARLNCMGGLVGLKVLVEQAAGSA